jgi:splicing factor 3A subunit 1
LFGLIKREARNPQFEFLNPGHHHYPFYSSLVEAYTKCLLPNTKSMAEQLKAKFSSKQEILQRLRARAEWEMKEAEAKRRAEEEAQKEREAMAAIDWYDFVVVETIDFYNDEELPPPLTYQQLMDLGKKPLFEPRAFTDAIETNDEMEMETTEQPMEPASPPPNHVPQPQPPLPKQEEIDDSENMKIIKDYDYSRVRHQQQSRSLQVQICPKCGQEVPVDEMEEHMKIELLDPRARAIRQAQQDRHKASILASDEEISKNLGQFARRRTDIFGEKEVAIGKIVGEDESGRPEKVIWDGHAGSIPQTTQAALGLSLQEQAAKASKGPEPIKPLIGAELPASMSINPAPAVKPPVPLPPPMMVPMVPGQPMMLRPMMPGQPMMPPMMPPMMQMPHMGMFPPMPMMGQQMPMPQDLHPPPDDDDDDHTGKKQKMENVNLIPASDWLAANPGPAMLKIQLPTSEEKQEWNLNGQVLEITIEPQATIATLKEKLSAQLGGMPVNKQKLKTADSGFFKDTCTLAYYNVGSGTTLYMNVKSRGRGRKK